MVCAGGRGGRCLRQMAQVQPIKWTHESSTQPYTIMGELGWSNYTVSADVLLERSGSAAEVLGRVGTQSRNNGGLNAYHLCLSDTGAWSLMKTNTSWTWTTLAGGTVTAPGTNTWHNLSLAFQGTTITARIDGRTVATIAGSSYSGGMIGLGTAGYHPVQYSNLSITPGAVPDLSDTYQIVDVPNATTWPGTQLNLWTPGGATNQQWQVVPTDNGNYFIESRSNGYMLDVSGSSPKRWRRRRSTARHRSDQSAMETRQDLPI